MAQTIGNDVSFIRVANWDAWLGLANALIPGARYLVTVSFVDANTNIVSEFRALTASTYEVISKNAIVSHPVLGADGRSLTYKDSLGATKTIALSGLTIGDNSVADAILVAGSEITEIGAGNAVHTHDTLNAGFSKLQTLLVNAFTAQRAFATHDDLLAAVDAMMRIRGKVATSDQIGLLGTVGSTVWTTALRIGDAFTITADFQASSDWDGISEEQFEAGDVILVIDTINGTTGATCKWMSWQANLDVDTIMSGVQTPDTGEITVEVTYADGVLSTVTAFLATRLLGAWAKGNAVGPITANDTIGAAMAKLENRQDATELRGKWIEIA